MSLKEVYTLAHTAQCRLNIEASRPERNLRFVVGHLMHYESLRLRIVEIEHDISRAQRSKAVQFKGTGHVDHRLQHSPSSSRLARKSPPPPPVTADDLHDDNDNDDDDDDRALDDLMYADNDDDDDGNDGLSLQRFPSGSSRPPQQPPPDLEPDNPDEEDYDDYDDEPASPEEPDQATLENVLKSDGSESLAKMYEGVRNCHCHGETDAPHFDRMWELPEDEQSKDGKVRAVAEVSVAAT